MKKISVGKPLKNLIDLLINKHNTHSEAKLENFHLFRNYLLIKRSG